MQINDHSFLVAGGSSGLGFSCVQHLLARGAKVVIADIAEPPAESFSSSCSHSSCSHWAFCQTDVTDADQVQNAFSRATTLFGPLHGTLITAGTIHAERITSPEGPFNLEAFQRVININLTGSFNVLRFAAETMKNNPQTPEHERGVIITTSSVAAYEGQIGQAAYSASKGGIAALTLPAARELGRYAIRVVSIAPGVFETPMLGQVSEKYREAFESQTAFPKRFGHPEEFAALAGHIIENPMLNGEVIRLDGGLRMAAR